MKQRVLPVTLRALLSGASRRGARDSHPDLFTDLGVLEVHRGASVFEPSVCETAIYAHLENKEIPGRDRLKESFRIKLLKVTVALQDGQWRVEMPWHPRKADDLVALIGVEEPKHEAIG